MPLDGESKSLVSSGCRGWPTIGEPGYWLVLILAAIGITQGRYVFCKQKLGLSPICKCPDRAAAMNTIWQDALAWLKTTAQKLTLKGYNSTKE